VMVVVHRIHRCYDNDEREHLRDPPTNDRTRPDCGSRSGGTGKGDRSEPGVPQRGRYAIVPSVPPVTAGG
jgi:hypothetical protein